MKKNNIFWISYSDLMTSLFFVMLVLFVVTIGYLKKIQTDLEITIKEQEKILQINKQFKPLEQSGSFYYLPECKKYIVKDLMGKEIFEPLEAKIKSEYLETTIKAGEEIENFLKKLNKENPELSYLLVIEGNMANKYDKSISVDSEYGYKKSYERALAVYNLWVDEDIDLRQFNVEVMICGSGFNGLCREDKEDDNKRFSIQIIPKVQNRMNFEQNQNIKQAISSIGREMQLVGNPYITN